MELGIIGLGRMGLGLAQRLHRGAHRVVGFARSADTRARAQEQGVEPAASIEALVGLLKRPRAVWMMVPAGDVVDETIAALTLLLAQGDTIIDGGNSNYKDTQRRAKSLSEKEIDYIDCGTSGGVWGLEQGYSLMIGGDERATERLRPIFATLAPAPDKGWGRVGTSGAGHFTKMIHNGIEYGLMQAYGEGFALMQHKREFALDLHQVAQIWRHGSVVRSWLLDLTAAALAKNPQLEGIASYVADSGEGRWTVFEAVDLDVAAPVITLALLQRLRSRDANSFSDKLLAAMRQQFGGHDCQEGVTLGQKTLLELVLTHAMHIERSDVTASTGVCAGMALLLPVNRRCGPVGTGVGGETRGVYVGATSRPDPGHQPAHRAAGEGWQARVGHWPCLARLRGAVPVCGRYRYGLRSGDTKPARVGVQA